ncbi:MAG: AAA family ATPase [Proteobacteria bacterium]|nr:AAA family ATPase [Pseudomonadota bacterium]
MFRDFAWPSDLHCFGQFNLIYGWNGCGKTTLSSLFAHIEKGTNLAEGEVEFEIDDDRKCAGTTIATTNLPPVRGYSEQDLETETVCDGCTLRYAIYGVFGFCPDCGAHNNLNILDANLRLVAKMVTLAATADADVAKNLVENALEDCVSAFDGWGREVSEAFAAKAADPVKAGKVSFRTSGARTTRSKSTSTSTRRLSSAQRRWLHFIERFRSGICSPIAWASSTKTTFARRRTRRLARDVV